MEHERRKGLVYSAALHLSLLLLAVFGLPSFLQREIAPQPIVIAVDLLPISALTNVKTSDLPLAQVEKPVPQEEEEKPTPPVKVEEPPPPPPPPPKKNPEPKKPVPKDVKKPPKEDEFEKLMKNLGNEPKKPQKPVESKDAKDTQEAGTKVKGEKTNYDDSLPMSMSELDAIRSQIAKCWSVPAGAKNAENLQVTLRVQLDQTGMVVNVEIADESKARYMSGDTFFRAAADSAMRAVRQCSPLRNLPTEKYQTWKDIIMTFDPKEMLF